MEADHENGMQHGYLTPKNMLRNEHRCLPPLFGKSEVVSSAFPTVSANVMVVVDGTLLGFDDSCCRPGAGCNVTAVFMCRIRGGFHSSMQGNRSI